MWFQVDSEKLPERDGMGVLRMGYSTEHRHTWKKVFQAPGLSWTEHWVKKVPGTFGKQY